jgi:plasmid stability protein
VLSFSEETKVPNITLRGVPDHLHQELRSAASRNNRSLNGEILSRLTESSVSPQARDTKALLERIRKLRETIGPIDVSEEDIREMRNEGRP